MLQGVLKDLEIYLVKNWSTSKHVGYCDICEKDVIFFKSGDWLRDKYFCLSCKSIPRQRAIVSVVKQIVPNYRDLFVHESSPAGVSSDFFRQKCSRYTFSQFFSDIPSGELKNGVMCQDLNKLSFNDESLDLFLTQDVFEHLLHPEKALREIRRVLKPGGFHIFTFPWYYWKETVKRVGFDSNGEKIYFEPKIYHGNPVDENGSIVTYDWGYDVVRFIDSHGFKTQIFKFNEKKRGLQAEFLEVFVSKAI